jgi:DNA-binding NtrC family response regulator
MEKSLLLVEDDPFHREMLQEALQEQGFCVTIAEDGEQALEAFGRNVFAVALIDIRLPDMDDFSLLELILSRYPACSVLLMTGQATVEAAVEAMNKGAHDYLPKPFRMELLLLKLQRLFHLKAVEEEIRQLKHSVDIGIIGRSPAFRRFMATAESVAATDATVLIQGESGTGKELVAEFLHGASPRKKGPLVKVNCGAIPETLLESELFGYEKGAFTGAERTRRGYLEQAEGGTLFLDEIGEIPHAMQVKLLRVLQDRQIRRLGGEKPIRTDFRLVAATHRDFEELREEGTIREDFYFRLKVIPLAVPALRARREDLSLLLEHFIQRYASRYDRPAVRFSPKTMDCLQAYSFPGNIRELENLVERLVVLAPAREIHPHHLPAEYRQGSECGSELIQFFRTELPLREAIKDFEIKFINRVLQEEKGNRSAAARHLGISRKNLWEKLSG